MDYRFRNLLKNPQDLKLKIEKRIKRAQSNFELIQKVFKICEKFEGKRISKRIAGEFTKNYPEYKVNYNPSYGMYHLKIWGNGLEWDDHLSSLICYHNDPIVRLENVKKFNQCYVLEEGRVERMKEGLREVDYLINKWNSAVKVLDEVNSEAENFELGFEFWLG